ncbi:MAG: dTDP-4-dehydrorhamnose reductase [Syntrophomonadaceae bacterium]|jgi:dTDP-4-dehydrorhamnose reductase|nr:dTDP-4-dehydrorhamnose reductase [Syntrophomonadaceae bacterium]MDH7497846.1 dTDP-4-dehydrorhamnose reductase [Syntrophomonadaceae bacterium]
MSAGSMWPTILLLGCHGQIGWELRRTLSPLGNVTALDRPRLQFERPASLRQEVRGVKPDLIVNAAAYTAVDQAEEQEALAMAVNAEAPAVLAEEALRLGAVLVHYSTDYVFDGAKDSPYTEEDVPAPLNAYGRSKLAGDQAIAAAGCDYLILRTAWVYGQRGENFVRKVVRLAQQRRVLHIVYDQVGAPTWCRSVAEATALMLARGPSAVRERKGLYHLTAGGQTSWYGFATAVFAALAGSSGLHAELVPVSSQHYPAAARRPAYSVLSNRKVVRCFGLQLPSWEEGLALALESAPEGWLWTAPDSH